MGREKLFSFKVDIECSRSTIELMVVSHDLQYKRLHVCARGGGRKFNGHLESLN